MFVSSFPWWYRGGSDTLPAQRIQYSLFERVVLSPDVTSDRHNKMFCNNDGSSLVVVACHKANNLDTSPKFRLEVCVKHVTFVPSRPVVITEPTFFIFPHTLPALTDCFVKGAEWSLSSTVDVFFQSDFVAHLVSSWFRWRVHPRWHRQHSLFERVVLSPNVISNGYNTPFVGAAEPTRTKVIESHGGGLAKEVVVILNNDRNRTICEYQITDFH